MKKMNRVVAAILCFVMIVSMYMPMKVYAKTYKAGKTYTLSGRLKKVTFRHEGTGKTLKEYVLKLDKKITVWDSFEGKTKVRYISINQRDLSKEMIKRLKKYKGKKVKVRGEIFVPANAWYYSYVAIFAKSVKLK